MDKEMLEIAALWENSQKNGDKYFSGNLGKAKILIFPNKWKKNPNDPDFRMFLVKNEKKKDAPANSETSQGWAASDGDDIPF